MEGDNIHFPDSNKTHDHTYYGSFCSDPWDSTKPNYGGSGVACTSRIRQTGDGENQKNGTYYHSQAASSGTSASMSTENANTPDTFCPLGWQMPYSGTGGDYYNKSRSLIKLFTTYSISYAPGTASDATKIKSYPFSYVYSGVFYWYTGRLYYQSNYGDYWSSTINATYNSYLFYTWSNSLKPEGVGSKAYGSAIRCITRK